MNRAISRGAGQIIVVFAVVAAACSASADITRAELVDVVQRDAIAFDGEAVPAPLLDRLATNRVVVFGETHHLRDHWQFVADVLRDLHPSGHRQLLVELPQMVDWVLDDWVTMGGVESNWVPPNHIERKFAAIRAFNESLPADQRIHVRSIDANEAYYGGARDFIGLFMLTRSHLPEPRPIDEHIDSGYPQLDSAEQKTSLEALLATLDADGSALRASWGSTWYDTVVEMIESELASIDIRVERQKDDDSAARMREDLIKQLADTRIGEYPGKSVINFGAHHAQKAHLMGTNQEWLGDYLAHRSSIVGGSAVIVSFTSARTELEPGASGTPFDVMDASPENEILRLMAETWPGRTVFLPLDDPMFIDRTVALNSEEVTYVTALKEQFDGLLQYGLAHRWPEE